MERIILVNAKDGRKLLGIGASALFRLDSDDDFTALDDFLNNSSGKFRFITLSYDLKNKLLPLVKEERSGFPLVECWTAKAVVDLESGKIMEGSAFSGLNEVIQRFSDKVEMNFPSWNWMPTQSKEDYLHSVNEILHHIQRGDIYETNFCQEFFAEVSQIDPFGIYKELSEATNAPYAVFLDTSEFFVAGASPELFLRKSGSRLISRPIKGTAPRGKTSEEDLFLRSQLAQSEKDKRENVMIVDLVRNDFSRIAQKDSVKVPELFGVHTFNTVHQMISEVECEIKEQTTFCDIIEATFPMGSMTGAPKVSAVKIADRLEAFDRGIYSGSIGVILPNNDFELNVMIRSLVYDKLAKRMSCGVGGAITIASDPESEYEECKTKVGKILALFGNCEW